MTHDSSDIDAETESYHDYRRLSYVSSACLDTVCMNDSLGRGLLVTRVSVPRSWRGRGIGTDMMKNLCDHADRIRIPLYLFCMSSGEMNERDLADWYRRMGFFGDETTLMSRPPRSD